MASRIKLEGRAGSGAAAETAFGFVVELFIYLVTNILAVPASPLGIPVFHVLAIAAILAILANPAPPPPFNPEKYGLTQFNPGVDPSNPG